jgi:predicted AAA+ superfamily ATPase
MKRVYQQIVAEHFAHDEQMLFLAGPRQVGKTQTSLIAEKLTSQCLYLNWDTDEQRDLILQGTLAIATKLGLHQLRDPHHQKPAIIFDEIHKYPRWKNFLKGFYDNYQSKTHIIVTGSSKLDVYRRGGDSLMGRYFLYRVYPLSVAECISPQLFDTEIHQPEQLDELSWQHLWQFGGFPSPFLKHDKRYFNRWRQLRNNQLFREDIRDLTNIQEIVQLELLAQILKEQVSGLLNLTNLAKSVRVSVSTISRWINALQQFYYCFTIQPWTKNVIRSLLKEPKLYLWNWADVTDPGARAENLVACHLKKAVDFWTDRGFGQYQLYFIRDKEQREVDFLVTRDKKPWFLVEVKQGGNHSISEHLYRFQQQLKADHAFQVVFDLPYVKADCFKHHEPIAVPARTFLSQLV